LWGANVDDDLGSGSGLAYIFARDEGGLDNWEQVKKLTASDGSIDGRFGWSVSISGDLVLARAIGNLSHSGSSYLFARNEGGDDNWGQLRKLTATDGSVDDRFGWLVSVSGQSVLVGAFQADESGTDSGAAFLFMNFTN